MADSAIVFGVPVEVSLNGVRYSLHPLTLEHLGRLKELLTAERLKSIPPIETVLRAVDVSEFDDNAMSKFVAQVMYEHALMHTKAREVSFDDVAQSVNDPATLLRCFEWCLKDSAGVYPGNSIASPMILKSLRMKLADPDCNMQRWLEISGIKDVPNPQSSGTAS